MSYIKKRGEEAAEAAMQEQVDASKALIKFKSGSKHTLVLPFFEKPEDAPYVQYDAHSVYNVFFTTPCLRDGDNKDMYDLAVDVLWKEAYAAKDAGHEDLYEEIKDQAVALMPNERYLIGFFSMETGQPAIADVTKAQAELIIGQMKKYKTQAQTFRFELWKTGQKRDTKVGLDPILDPMSEKDQKRFDELKVKAFDFNLFEECLYIKPEAEQLEDLHKFGFDLAKIGKELPKKDDKPAEGSEASNDAPPVQDNNEEPKKDDLGF